MRSGDNKVAHNEKGIDNLFLPFDLYTRNELISSLIKKMKHSLVLENLKILDIGGRNSRLKDFLDASDSLCILDMRESENNEKNYLVGDIRNTHFDNGEFDAAIASDVYEHIPSKDRLKTLSEMIRISKFFVILASPFNSPEVVNAENLVNELYREFTGQEHIWLLEHIKNGLPFEYEVDSFLRSDGLKFTKFGTNNVETWLHMQLLNFIFSTDVNYKKRADEVNHYYNSFYPELGDNIEPTYRKMFLISKMGILPDIEVSDEKINHEKFRKLNSLIFSTIINLLKEKDRNIAEKEHLIAQIYNTKGWRFLEKYRNAKLVKAARYLRSKGLRETIKKIKGKWLKEKENEYKKWILRNEPSTSDLKTMKETAFHFLYRPKISIITPVYNTDEKWLRLAIESVINQIYDNWELCIADGGSTKGHVRVVLDEYAKKDNRINVKFLSENKGIAGNSNEALSLVTGDFVALLDHDDLLPPFALFEIAKAINENQDVDLIYSDEDKISEDGKERFEPHFKPDWSPDTLRSYNYITHLSVFRKHIVDKIGWFRKGYDGSQDYDLILRAIEQAKKIIHVPKILYHWRVSRNSTAGNLHAKLYAYEAAKKALRDHLSRIGLKGEVEDGLFLSSYKTIYEIKGNPKVSIIIPNKDCLDDLRVCIKSILDKTTYKNYEIIIVENNSVEQETFNYYDEIAKLTNIRVITWNNQFNFSAANNFGVRYAAGEFLLFLNNDTEVINPDWLERLLEHAQRPEVGAVGAKLYYHDDKIQHAGVIIGIGGVAGHSHKFFPREADGYMGRAKVIQNLSAVTAACMMMRKEVFEEIGGFDEGYPYAFNDVDLCMKIREKGYLIVWTPYAQLYHYESKSRGYEDTPEKQERFKKEIEYFQKKWKLIFDKGDPYYNPNLTLEREDFSIRI